MLASLHHLQRSAVCQDGSVDSRFCLLAVKPHVLNNPLGSGAKGDSSSIGGGSIIQNPDTQSAVLINSSKRLVCHNQSGGCVFSYRHLLVTQNRSEIFIRGKTFSVSPFCSGSDVFNQLLRHGDNRILS